MPPTEAIYLKLGGSLITDKGQAEAVRRPILGRIAREIAVVKHRSPDLKLLLGHGSGSFGHVAGAKYGTRQGVETAEQWFGFTEVSDAALRLNRIVVAALRDCDLPAMSFSPSASARVRAGEIVSMAVEPLRRALFTHALLPVVHGDVAFDDVLGGTIISTEEVFTYLLGEIPAGWLLLAGETDGVYDGSGRTIPEITPASFGEVAAALGGSRGTDVTGGMASKVRQMLDLVGRCPTLKIKIFSGLAPDALQELLLDPTLPIGTTISV